MSIRRYTDAPTAQYHAEVQKWVDDRAAEQEQANREGRLERDSEAAKRGPLTVTELLESEERRARYVVLIKAAKAKRDAVKKIREEYAEQDAQAAPYRGVRYDPRLKKFVARFYDRRSDKELWLGAHDTASDAGAAYQAHFAKAPKKAETNAEAYQRWQNTVGIGKEGYPLLRQVFVAPDGQKFELVGAGLGYSDGGKQWREYHFASPCRTCGKTYFFSSAPGATGFTRNCEEHRRRGRWGPSSKKQQDAAHEPEDGSDLV